MAFTVRQGDLDPVIRSALEDEHGRPVDLTDATVWLHLYNSDTDVERLYREASIVDAQGGQVRYEWQPSETDTVGQFNAAWEIVYPDGRRLVFDDPDPPTVEIVDDIAV